MTKLAWQRTGQGLPLVLVHGFPLDHTFWRPILPYLEPHFDCILPDLRGFGDSPAAEAGYSLDDMAADLSLLLGELGLPSAFFAGHSMGGYIALAFARRFERQMLGLALLGSQAAADTHEKRADRYETLERVKHEGIGIMLGMAEKLSVNPAHFPMFREIIRRQKPAGVIGGLQAMAERPNSIFVLSTLTIPVVLVHGLQDTLIPVERAREMKTAHPAAMLIELPGVGHSPPVEAPEQTAAALHGLL